MIVSRAPARISFVGGGTDVSPFTEEYGSKVINVAINKYCYTTIQKSNKIELKDGNSGHECRLEPKKLGYNTYFDIEKSCLNFFNPVGVGIKLSTFSEIPKQSGLGGSATKYISILGALNEFYNFGWSNYHISEHAFYLEREELNNIGGRQDQYCSAFGGFNYMEFGAFDNVKVDKLKLKPWITRELKRRLLLFRINNRPASGNIIAEQTKNVMNNTSTIAAMFATKLLVTDTKKHLIKGNIEELGADLDTAWKLKKEFSKKISNKKIDKIYSELKRKGAIGGKVSGAGGGGHMFMLVKEGKIHDVVRKAKQMGIKQVPFSFDFEGLTTWEVKK